MAKVFENYSFGATSLCITDNQNYLKQNLPAKSSRTRRQKSNARPTTITKQEALLSQTDRATRRVGRMLVNCCMTVKEQLVRQPTGPEKIEVTELKGYSRPTYNKLVHLAMTRSTVLGVIHKLTVDEFADNTCGKIF